MNHLVTLSPPHLVTLSNMSTSTICLSFDFDALSQAIVRQTVLCVGGRTGNIANYRDLIERVGGRFAHHDGGLEDNQSVLDASLAAAERVRDVRTVGLIMLGRMDQAIAKRTGLPVRAASDALICVAMGAGQAMEEAVFHGALAAA